MSARNEAKRPFRNRSIDRRLRDRQMPLLPSGIHRDGHAVWEQSGKVLTALLLASLTVSEVRSPEILELRRMLDLLRDLQDTENRATTVRRLYKAITNLRGKLD